MDLRSWFRTEIEGITIYKVWNLERTGIVTHGFAARTGGVSQAPYDTLNLGLHVDDDPANVMENRVRLVSAMRLPLEAVTCAQQVHGSSIAVITSERAGNGSERFSDSAPGVDALITNSPDAVLTMFFADCVPLFILDPINRAVGLAHAGWKGTALRVAVETVRAMQSEFGTDPSECLAAIGPSVGRCCYDVSMDVAGQLRAAAGDDRVIARISNDGWRADLKLANWIQLKAAGIRGENISVSHDCTACNRDDFFSYRRDGPTGRMTAILALKG